MVESKCLVYHRSLRVDWPFPIGGIPAALKISTWQCSFRTMIVLSPSFARPCCDLQLTVDLSIWVLSESLNG